MTGRSYSAAVCFTAGICRPAAAPCRSVLLGHHQDNVVVVREGVQAGYGESGGAAKNDTHPDFLIVCDWSFRLRFRVSAADLLRVFDTIYKECTVQVVDLMLKYARQEVFSADAHLLPLERPALDHNTLVPAHRAIVREVRQTTLLVQDSLFRSLDNFRVDESHPYFIGVNHDHAQRHARLAEQPNPRPKRRPWWRTYHP